MTSYKIIFEFLIMDRNKVSKYLQICKKYDYEQILNENVEFQDEKDIITYIKMLGKLDHIYDKYHEMKSGGGSGGKGAKSKSSKSKSKSKQKKKHKEHDSDDGYDDDHHRNNHQNRHNSPTQNNLLVEGLEVAGLTAMGTSLYNATKNSGQNRQQQHMQNKQQSGQNRQSVRVDLNKEQSEKLKLEILNEIETQLTLPDSVLSVLLENRINKILEKQK